MPNAPAARQFARAYEHHQAGALAEAEVRYRQLLSRQPSNVDALHMLGALCAQTNRLPQAENYLRKALQRNPENATVWFNLGNTLRDAGRMNDAKQAFEKACEVDPTHASAHFNLGITLLDLHEISEAVTAIEKTIKLDASHDRARQQLAMLYFAGEFYEAARDELLAAIEIRPDMIEYHHNLGSVYRKLGEPKRAMACFELALTLAPDSAPTMINLAGALLEDDRHTEARSMCLDAQAIEPDNERAAALLESIDAAANPAPATAL